MGTFKTTTYDKKHITTTQITCPVQVLVIDRPGGSAEVMMDTVSRLVNKDISIVYADDARQAIRQLDAQEYDLLVIGIEHNLSEPLSVMPYIRIQHPNLPVLLIGRKLRSSDRDCAQHFQVNDVFILPKRAEEMKQAAHYISTHYLA
jgi:DNA-binding NtrC family response regulator